MTLGLHSTKLPQSWDTRADHPGVPACTEQFCKTKRECESAASVGATPSKELCNCPTSTGILSKGWA